ncbi:uncharacterized protein LOC129792143 isoform X1 [Lutzomyia longipalpis]|uniref:uncharacterized protein LOC129792143 isoform X1 n=1 Tax=Lutzomyia longipalpis TaxID=7200 RepID=UPI002483446A|nr:uncharacterized protein LOC129792143 isoform X1 [Lutzomyia longipalpis]
MQVFFQQLIFLLVVSVTFCNVLCRPANEESEDNDDKSDLEASEFFFWPKFFFVKPAVAVVKAAPVVAYEYQPVNYTYYRPVWTPYTVTVQKPVAVAAAAPAVVAETPVVAAKGVSVNVGGKKVTPNSYFLYYFHA